MKNRFSVILMLIVSLITAGTGLSGCAASENKALENIEEAKAPENAEEARTLENTEEARAFENAEAAPAEYTVLDDYQKWAKDVGYPQNMLVPMGVDGINQDYFHTLPDAPGYTSGKIVIGDSRCCQLGIFEQRTDADGFADYAVWGGHFLPGAEPPAITDQVLSEVEHCFQEQIKAGGKCSIYFFATVNDYDYIGNENDDSIAAAVKTAETLAGMSFEDEGRVYQPEVIVIGFDGGEGDILYRIPAEDFNRYVDDYNQKLRAAVSSSTLLQENIAQFTTIPEITGGRTGFNEDGLHYSDSTLKEIVDYIAEH